jgi:outer membrane protein OmpA-like peptidoglycan-associated protein
MNRKIKIMGLITGLALLLLGMPLAASAARLVIGVGGPYYGGWYGGPGYYYPGPYYYPSYYYPPATVYAPPAVTVEQAPATYWYYCPPARAYFPYVHDCPTGWQAVPASAQPARAAAAPAAPVAPAPAPAGRVTYSLGDVLFATGKSDLQPAALSTLDSVLAAISKEPKRSIVVEGHTDSVGSASANLELSQRRADAVMQYLVAHGIAPQRIKADGRGEANPVDTNATAEGRQHNRRVDVIVG